MQSELLCLQKSEQKCVLSRSNHMWKIIFYVKAFDQDLIKIPPYVYIHLADDLFSLVLLHERAIHQLIATES